MSDRASAEQREAIRARAPLVTVSAGAGSGKTTVLVERFIDLVQRDGVSPLEILAVTFTEKAAAEMKERIVREFEKRGDIVNRRLAEAAYISTIHGFCSRILREHPLAARLDPSFRVMDEVTRSVFIDEYLEELYADDWYVETEPLISKRFESLRPRLIELIMEAAFLPDEFGTSVTTEAHLTEEGHVAVALERARTYFENQRALARDQLLDGERVIASAHVSGDASCRSHENMCGLIDRLRRDAATVPEWPAEFRKHTGFTRGVANGARDAIKDVFDVVRKTLKTCDSIDLAEIERTEREIFAPIKVGIYKHAAELREKYEAFKRKHGLIDFTDMQRRASELLEDASVRDRYAKRFKHILLDEAQDTNDVQMRLVDRLQHDGQSLFAVGDVKQSIYGFRGANVEIFQRLARGGDRECISLSLVDNYRSRDRVIAFINEVGSRFWPSGDITYERLAARAPYEPNGAAPDVDVWFIDQPDIIDENGKERREPIDETREREGIAIAEWIRREIDRRQALRDADDATTVHPPIRYRDIAILSNTRNPFPAIERALADFGIPFVKDGGREFFNGLEVQDLLAALRVIDNPLDDVNLLTALRSPLFGWGDRDLTRLRAASAGPLWYAMRSIEPLDDSADASAYDTIRMLRRQASVTSPVALIEMLCDVTAYRAALLCLPRGRAHVANIDKLIEFARATALLDGPSLTSFLHRATLAERYLSNETDAPASSAGDDAVVLSTIHGAKGLEWPVVILAGLDSDYARTEVTSRYYAPEGALILQVKQEGDDGPLRSGGNGALVAAAKARDEAEGRRLFYVGMTRARERLILTSTFRYSDSRSESARLGRPVAWLANELGVTDSLLEAIEREIGKARVRAESFPRDRVEEMRSQSSRNADRQLGEVRRAIRDGRPVQWEMPNASIDTDALVDRILTRSAADSADQPIALTTVTQLVYFFRCPLVYYFGLVLQLDEHPRGRGKTGPSANSPLSALERGTRVHELLERADFAASPVAETKRLVTLLDDVDSEEVTKIERLVQNVLTDPLMDRVRDARRVEREYPFFLDLGGTTVQGVIDLVFEDARGRGVVVDYKSNDLKATGRVEALTELYRPQIELYALAAKRAGLIEPDEGTLYFLNGSKPVPLPVDTNRLDGAESRAAEALVRIGRSAWDTEPGEKCRSCGYGKRGYCEVGKGYGR